MGNRGVSITEVVLALLVSGAIIAGAATSYQGWLKRYKVEKATMDLYADLMKARMLAISRNVDHFAVLNSGSYSLLEDVDGSGRPSNGDITLATYPKTLEYALNRNGSGNKIYFNTRGIMTPERTLWFSTSTDPDYDCLVISFTRIALGRYVDGTCKKK